jgi:ESF2/ABP1 family protein
MHAARLRLELSQSRSEQREYLKNVELARVLDKREERSQAAGKHFRRKEMIEKRREKARTISHSQSHAEPVQLENVLGDVF